MLAPATVSQLMHSAPSRQRRIISNAIGTRKRLIKARAPGLQHPPRWQAWPSADERRASGTCPERGKSLRVVTHAPRRRAHLDVVGSHLDRADRLRLHAGEVFRVARAT